jgi:hypothetical protein
VEAGCVARARSDPSAQGRDWTRNLQALLVGGEMHDHRGTMSLQTIAFHFWRDDGRGFDVGDGTVPAGLRAVVDLLHMAQSQTTATCAGF